MSISRPRRSRHVTVTRHAKLLSTPSPVRCSTSTPVQAGLWGCVRTAGRRCTWVPQCRGATCARDADSTGNRRQAGGKRVCVHTGLLAGWHTPGRAQGHPIRAPFHIWCSMVPGPCVLASCLLGIAWKGHVALVWDLIWAVAGDAGHGPHASPPRCTYHVEGDGHLQGPRRGLRQALRARLLPRGRHAAPSAPGGREWHLRLILSTG